jgi:hypothetical protein
MAYEGRKVDLCAQIYCVVSSFFLIASCWWQAAAMVRKAEARIPRNKMRPRSLELGIFGQALLCLVVLLAAAMLPWREEALAMKDPGASFNKALFGRRASEANQGGDSSSKRHGGDTRKEQAEICSRISHCYGVVMLQNQGEHSRWPKDWPPTLKTIWWSRSKLALMAMASSTSKEASSQALGSASLSPGDKWFRPRLRRGRLQVELQLLRRVQGTRLLDIIFY